jgi:hypothetical protein
MKLRTSLRFDLGRFPEVSTKKMTSADWAHGPIGRCVVVVVVGVVVVGVVVGVVVVGVVVVGVVVVSVVVVVGLVVVEVVDVVELVYCGCAHVV